MIRCMTWMCRVIVELVVLSRTTKDSMKKIIKKMTLVSKKNQKGRVVASLS